MVRQVQPLRISKAGTTPATTPLGSNMAQSRPLAEIGSGSQRRNSPSYNQATRKMIVSRDSSPYAENSFTNENPSPRDFWSKRDPMSPSRFDSENMPERERAPNPLSTTRRASIEKLKQAGRVKTSNIFALESKDAYDPSNLPIVERPSANRPLSGTLVNNSFTRFDSMKKENSPLTSPRRLGHKRTESETAVPLMISPIKSASSPLKDFASSPTKSSLARSSQFGSPLEHDTGPWSDSDDRAPTPRAIHRHHKSVTFHEDPPVVNEYENPTPEPSVSAASGSREGSWESDEFYDDYSFDRGSSLEQRDDSFDADLENTDKTPVVLPEDWSRMSPDEARRDLVDDGDDVFEGSEIIHRPTLRRSESVTSDAESRPLPPLPDFMAGRRNSAAAAAERATNLARNLPSPPKRASCSKDDIRQMARESSLTMEDRLQLVVSHTHSEAKPRPHPKHGHAELTINKLDTGEKSDVNVEEEEIEDESQLGDFREFDHEPPKISRESILRKVRNSKYDFEEDSDAEPEIGTENSSRPSYEELAKMHPDDPIPSRECSRDVSDNYLGDDVQAPDEIEVKEEQDDDAGIDLQSIPQFQEPQVSPEYQRESSVLRHDLSSHSDSESRYSSAEPDAESTVLQTQQNDTELTEADDGKEKLEDAMQLLSVKDFSPREAEAAPTQKKSVSGDFMGLPSYLASDDFDFGINDFMKPSHSALQDAPRQIDITASAPVLQPCADIKPAPRDLPRPTYDGAEYDDPDYSLRAATPDSAVHQSGSDLTQSDEQTSSSVELEPEVDIPERRATIKTNGQLKARPSATPADFHTMAEQRRLVSAEHPVPNIPEAFQAEIGQTTDIEEDLSETSHASSEGVSSKADSAVEQSPERSARSESRRQSRKQMKLDLDIPAISADSADDGLGLESEFERVIEGQKKGYLMRHNTKLVVATNRNVSGDSNGTSKSNESTAPKSSTTESRPGSRGGKSSGDSSRKPSAEQFLKTEPWNGKARRKSQRQASAAQYASGPAPPLPGQSSALGVVNEDFAAGTSSLQDDVDEGVERGRLFVKVSGVKDLDLPIPRNDRLYFQLTLDNGLHCVTTTSLELGKNAPIGQEFELVVLNDLEFQLTLTTKLPPPPKQDKPTASSSSSPTKNVKHQKSSSLSRFLTSPKKRAEKERQEREAVEAEERRVQEEQRRMRASEQPTAWDMLHELVNSSDGSFARAYVNLKAHEKHCFGRKLSVKVPCYNEWALERDTVVVNSVRSKRGNAGPIRRPPYVVGFLELELLYVPKPAGAGDELMPKSMSSAVREMNRASEHVEIVHEGYLSQQGGDCVHWRRRFFRLHGPRLTAYHEHTQQKRAVINLGKATRLVDDKRTLVADLKSGNPASRSGRRKSAFAEEDEGYQYVEEGFRIRFANGETIDFYADSRADKDEWMNALSQVLGKSDAGKKAASWTDLVIAREKAEGVPPQVQVSTSTSVEVRDFTKPPAPARKSSDRKPVLDSRSVAGSPMKGLTERRGPMSPLAEPQARPQTPPMSARRGHRSRDAVKSMIF